MREDKQINRIDITGQLFGKLTVSNYTGKDSLWNCRCECGNNILAKSARLRAGFTRSCGCKCDAENLIGQVFGKLTVISLVNNIGISPRWVCKCDCGGTATVTSAKLKNGNNKSCGCLQPGVNYGQRFSKLVAIRCVNSDKYNRKIWRCVCDCGGCKDVSAQNLIQGDTQSCGCLSIGNWSKQGYGEITYKYFDGIRRGASSRGLDFDITISQIWDLFITQGNLCALSGVPIILDKRYKAPITASLDRIDSSKGYTQDNIQWIHKDINKMKNNFPEDYFIKVCNEIAKHRSIGSEVSCN